AKYLAQTQNASDLIGGVSKSGDRYVDHTMFDMVQSLTIADSLTVVGVTANALAEEKQRCLESGMDSCLSKPVTLDVLKQTLAVYA
ncbi:hypothetical protein MJL22_27990, partial [Salmonella enterica subsp. enterica serovar Montevideo]|nr:hypothetical protein [Salmonella enterica subsp. enterica serovar Montevideo]